VRTHAASFASIPALMGLLLSMTPSGLGADITLVPSGATVEIDAHDECRLVRNNNAAGLMVPHRFATEWVSGGASFLENTPANVVVSPCPAGSDNCEGTIQRAGFNPSFETQRQMSIAHVVAVGSTNGWCGGNENDNSTTYNIGDRTTWAEWSAKYPTSITDPTYNSIPLHSFVLQNACLDNHDLMNTYTSGYAFFVPDGCELSGGYWGSNPNFPCECEAPPAFSSVSKEQVCLWYDDMGHAGFWPACQDAIGSMCLTGCASPPPGLYEPWTAGSLDPSTFDASFFMGSGMNSRAILVDNDQPTPIQSCNTHFLEGASGTTVVQGGAGVFCQYGFATTEDMVQAYCNSTGLSRVHLHGFFVNVTTNIAWGHIFTCE